MLKALRESVHSQQGAPWGKEEDRERQDPGSLMRKHDFAPGTIWLLELILSMPHSK